MFTIFECLELQYRLFFLKYHLKDCLEGLIEGIAESIQNLWLVLKLKINRLELVLIKSELEEQGVLVLEVFNFLDGAGEV